MSESMNVRQAYCWIVTGRVQGVSYRYFTRKNAIELGLCGWVRNLPDGTVEVQFEADPEKVEAFRERLLQGPVFGRVDRIDEEVLSSTELSASDESRWQTFEIRY